MTTRTAATNSTPPIGDTTNTTTAAASTTEPPSSSFSSSSSSTLHRQPKIVFIHLDLGIGGAEQLIVNLALASLPPNSSSSSDNNATPAPPSKENVLIYTSHCSPTHCFSQVKPPNGTLSSSVQIRGTFLPQTIFGYGTAFCSTIRMLYLTYCASKECREDVDLYVLDVLPTSIPFLVNWWSSNGRGKKSSSGVLYYCHFPDKLLTRDTVNGIVIGEDDVSAGASAAEGGDDGGGGLVQKLKSILGMARSAYRTTLDYVEEYTMRYADVIAVNSNFTRGEVLRVFPSLAEKQQQSTMEQVSPAGEAGSVGDERAKNESDHNQHESSSSSSLSSSLAVLYPPIDLNKFIQPNFQQKEKQLLSYEIHSPPAIVSLNRFERKKNIQLLLHAFNQLVSKLRSKQRPVPKLIIAGGYDPRNIENVEYINELRQLAAKLDIFHHCEFKPSISDEERATILQEALCVVYTPHREHFGIVPLEAMYAGSPVVAVKSGGPMETVVDGKTGYLCENNSESFAKALETLVLNPKVAIQMGKNGHEHVKNKFGLNQFRSQWEQIVKETITKGQERCAKWEQLGYIDRTIFPRYMTYIWECILALISAFVLTVMLRYMGLLEPNGHVWGEVRKRIYGIHDEF